MTFKLFARTCTLFILLGCQLSYQVKAEELLTVAWRTKPPYQYLENGIEKGPLLERARLAFAQAQIRSQFINEPGNRIWSKFSSGAKNYCSFDWYRIPERESLVQFSRPFNRSPPYMVLASPAAARQVAAHRSVSALLADPRLTLGVVDAASYGSELDGMIRQGKNKLERSMVLPMILARMVGANRASFMFIDRTDWEYLKATEKNLYQGQLFELEGIPAGLDSYVVCSKDVAPEKMLRINAAIQKIWSAKKDELLASSAQIKSKTRKNN